MKICVMMSTYKMSESDPTSVAPIVESIQQLARRGVEVHVFAPSYKGLKSHVVGGVPVHRFRYFLRRWENLTHKQGAPSRIRNPLYLFVAFFYILFGLVHAIRLCRKHRFDLIQVHWPFPHGIWGYAASRLSGTPMLLTFHGAELLLCRRFFFVKYFLRHAIRHAQAITCNSNFTAGEVIKLADRPVEVVPYGCGLKARPVHKDATKPVKDILFVGRLIARKGVDFLLQAVPLLEGCVPAHLHIVGDGDKAREWKALAQELGIQDRVTFHGALPNEQLEWHYANADVFVLPAIVDDRGDTEGLGVVMVEAFSYRTPVVASNVGGIPDVIQDGQTGLLVPEKDPAALGAALQRVLQDASLAARLAERGLAHAQDYFDWNRIAQQWLEVFDTARARYHGRVACPEPIGPLAS